MTGVVAAQTGYLCEHFYSPTQCLLCGCGAWMHMLSCSGWPGWNSLGAIIINAVLSPGYIFVEIGRTGRVQAILCWLYLAALHTCYSELVACGCWLFKSKSGLF
jgi:hypothetical protein